MSLQFGHFVGAGLIPGDHDVQQFAVDRQVFDVVDRAYRINTRVGGHQRQGSLLGTTTDQSHALRTASQFDGAADHPIGAIVDVAFLEQHSTRFELTHHNLTGQ